MKPLRNWKDWIKGENDMNEERLLILRMLENGRITAEEAERLLRALGDAPKAGSGFTTRDLGSVWQDAARNVREMGKQVSEKLVKEIQLAMESLAALPEWFGRWEIGGAAVEQVYRASGSVESLEIRTLHGNVKLVAEERGDVEVHVRAQVSEEAAQGDEPVIDRLWKNEDGHLSLIVDEGARGIRGAHVVVRLPFETVRRVTVRQTNGRIRAERVQALEWVLSTVNGAVELEQVPAMPGGRVEVKVVNGRIGWTVPKGTALEGTIRTGFGVAAVDVPGRLSAGSRVVRRRGEVLLRAPAGEERCVMELDVRTGKADVSEV